MKDELANTQRLLEAVTTAGEAPVDRRDPEAASLREAWLAFGELLETAEMPDGAACHVSPLSLGEGQGVRAVRRWTQRRWLLPLAGALAASLLICIATAWMQRDTSRQDTATPVATHTTPIKRHAATPVPAQAWDDSLDEQVAQLGQQMASARDNQLASVDEFSLIQDRIEQFRQEVQADTL